MNKPVVWTPTMIVIAIPVVLCGVIGLALFSAVALVLLLLGLKPTESIR